MIAFFSEDIEFSVPNPVKTKRWLTNVSKSNDYDIENLNYIFCSDDYLLSINRQYLDHDYYTDIITFDNSEEDGILEGDIYISVDRVRENATSFGSDFNTELRRVIIHGLLHLIGFEDSTEELKMQMRSKEDEYLQLF